MKTLQRHRYWSGLITFIIVITFLYQDIVWSAPALKTCTLAPTSTFTNLASKIDIEMSGVGEFFIKRIKSEKIHSLDHLPSLIWNDPQIDEKISAKRINVLFDEGRIDLISPPFTLTFLDSDKFPDQGFYQIPGTKIRMHLFKHTHLLLPPQTPSGPRAFHETTVVEEKPPSGADASHAVFGDIHGNYENLIKFLEYIQDLSCKPGKLIFLGDYMDRGPCGIKVFEKIKELTEADKAIPLMGNHELIFMLAMMGDDESLIQWLSNDVGGNKVIYELIGVYGCIKFLEFINFKDDSEKERLLNIAAKKDRKGEYFPHIENKLECMLELYSKEGLDSNVKKEVAEYFIGLKELIRKNEKLKEIAAWYKENLKLYHIDEYQNLYLHAGIPFTVDECKKTFKIHLKQEDLRSMEDRLKVADSFNDPVFKELNTELSPVWFDSFIKLSSYYNIEELILNKLGVKKIFTGHELEKSFVKSKNMLFGLNRWDLSGFGIIGKEDIKFFGYPDPFEIKPDEDIVELENNHPEGDEKQFLYPARDEGEGKRLVEFTLKNDGKPGEQSWAEGIQPFIIPEELISFINTSREFYAKSLNISAPELKIRLIEDSKYHAFLDIDQDDKIITINIEHTHKGIKFNKISIDHEIGHTMLDMERLAEELALCLRSLQLILLNPEYELPTSVSQNHELQEVIKKIREDIKVEKGLTEHIKSMLELLMLPSVHPKLRDRWEGRSFDEIIKNLEYTTLWNEIDFRYSNLKTIYFSTILNISSEIAGAVLIDNQEKIYRDNFSKSISRLESFSAEKFTPKRFVKDAKGFLSFNSLKDLKSFCRWRYLFSFRRIKKDDLVIFKLLIPEENGKRLIIACIRFDILKKQILTKNINPKIINEKATLFLSETYFNNKDCIINGGRLYLHFAFRKKHYGREILIKLLKQFTEAGFGGYIIRSKTKSPAVLAAFHHKLAGRLDVTEKVPLPIFVDKLKSESRDLLGYLLKIYEGGEKISEQDISIEGIIQQKPANPKRLIFEKMIENSKNLEDAIMGNKFKEGGTEMTLDKLIPEWGQWVNLYESEYFRKFHFIPTKDHIMLAFRHLESGYYRKIIDSDKYEDEEDLKQLKRALFLHDLGKILILQRDPEYKSQEDHPALSSEMAKEILIRLGYTESEIYDDILLIRNHSVLTDLGTYGEAEFVPLEFVNNLKTIRNVRLLRLLTLADAASVRGHYKNSLSVGLEQRIFKITEMIENILITKGDKRAGNELEFLNYLEDIKEQNRKINGKIEEFKEFLKEKGIEIDPAVLDDALKTMNRSHLGQKRKDKKTPTVFHPLGTSRISIEELDERDLVTIIAALLHDVLEDTRTTRDAIENLFGDRLGRGSGKKIADIMTILRKPKSAEIDYSEELRDTKYLSGIVYGTDDIKDRDTLISAQKIKVADRIHNLRTLVDKEFARKQIRETYDLFFRFFIDQTDLPVEVKLKLINELIKQDIAWQILESKEIEALKDYAVRVTERKLPEVRIKESPYNFIKGLIEYTERPENKPEKPLVFAFEGMAGAGRSTFTNQLKNELIRSGKKVVIFDISDFLMPRDSRDRILEEVKERGELYYEARGNFYYFSRFREEVLKKLYNFQKSGSQALEIRLNHIYNRDTGKLDASKTYTIDRDTVVFIEGIHILQEEFLQYYTGTFLIYAPEDVCRENVKKREVEKQLAFGWYKPLLFIANSLRIRKLRNYIYRNIKRYIQEEEKINDRFNLIDWPSYRIHWQEYDRASMFFIDNTDYSNSSIVINTHCDPEISRTEVPEEYQDPEKRLNRKLEVIFKELKENGININDIVYGASGNISLLKNLLTVKRVKELVPKDISIPYPGDPVEKLECFVDQLSLDKNAANTFFKLIAAYVLTEIEVLVTYEDTYISLNKVLNNLSINIKPNIELFHRALKIADWQRKILPPILASHWQGRKYIPILIDVDAMSYHYQEIALAIKRLAVNLLPDQEIYIIPIHKGKDIKDVIDIFNQKMFYDLIAFDSKTAIKGKIKIDFEYLFSRYFKDFRSFKRRFDRQLVKKYEKGIDTFQIEPRDLLIIAEDENPYPGLEAGQERIVTLSSMLFNPSLPEDILLSYLNKQEWEKIKFSLYSDTYSSKGLLIKVPFGGVIITGKRFKQFIQKYTILRVINRLLNKFRHEKLVRKSKDFVKSVVSKLNYLLTGRKPIIYGYLKGYELIMQKAPHLIVPTRIIKDSNLCDKIRLKDIDDDDRVAILQKSDGIPFIDYIRHASQEDINEIMNKSFSLLQELWKYGLAYTDPRIDIWNNLIVTRDKEVIIASASDITDERAKIEDYLKIINADAERISTVLKLKDIRKIQEELEDAPEINHISSSINILLKNFEDDKAQEILKILLENIFNKLNPDLFKGSNPDISKGSTRPPLSCKFPGEEDLKLPEKQEIEDLINKQKNLRHILNLAQLKKHRKFKEVIEIIKKNAPDQHKKIRAALIEGEPVKISTKSSDFERYNGKEVYVKFCIVRSDNSRRKFFPREKRKLGMPIYPTIEDEDGRSFLNINILSTLLNEQTLTPEVLTGIIVHELSELLLDKYHIEAILEEKYYGNLEIPPHLLWMIDEYGRRALGGNEYIFTLLRELTNPYAPDRYKYREVSPDSITEIKRLSEFVSQRAQMWRDYIKFIKETKEIPRKDRVNETTKGFIRDNIKRYAQSFPLLDFKEKKCICGVYFPAKSERFLFRIDKIDCACSGFGGEKEGTIVGLLLHDIFGLCLWGFSPKRGTFRLYNLSPVLEELRNPHDVEKEFHLKIIGESPILEDLLKIKELPKSAPREERPQRATVDRQTKEQFGKIGKVILRYGNFLRRGYSVPLRRRTRGMNVLCTEVNSITPFEFMVTKSRYTTIMSVRSKKIIEGKQVVYSIRLLIEIPKTIGDRAKIGLHWDNTFGLLIWISNIDNNRFIVYQAEDCLNCFDETKTNDQYCATNISSEDNLDKAIKKAKSRIVLNKAIEITKYYALVKEDKGNMAELENKINRLNSIKVKIRPEHGGRLHISGRIYFGNIGEKGELFIMKYIFNKNGDLLVIFTSRRRKRTVVYSLNQYLAHLKATGLKRYNDIAPLAEGSDYREVLGKARLDILQESAIEIIDSYVEVLKAKGDFKEIEEKVDRINKAEIIVKPDEKGRFHIKDNIYFSDLKGKDDTFRMCFIRNTKEELFAVITAGETRKAFVYSLEQYLEYLELPDKIEPKEIPPIAVENNYRTAVKKAKNKEEILNKALTRVLKRIGYRDLNNLIKDLKSDPTLSLLYAAKIHLSKFENISRLTVYLGRKNQLHMSLQELIEEIRRAVAPSNIWQRQFKTTDGVLELQPGAVLRHDSEPNINFTLPKPLKLIPYKDDFKITLRCIKDGKTETRNFRFNIVKDKLYLLAGKGRRVYLSELINQGQIPSFETVEKPETDTKLTMEEINQILGPEVDGEIKRRIINEAGDRLFESEQEKEQFVKKRYDEILNELRKQKNTIAECLMDLFNRREELSGQPIYSAADTEWALDKLADLGLLNKNCSKTPFEFYINSLLYYASQEAIDTICSMPELINLSEFPDEKNGIRNLRIKIQGWLIRDIAANIQEQVLNPEEDNEIIFDLMWGIDIFHEHIANYYQYLSGITPQGAISAAEFNDPIKRLLLSIIISAKRIMPNPIPKLIWLLSFESTDLESFRQHIKDLLSHDVSGDIEEKLKEAIELLDEIKDSMPKPIEALSGQIEELKKRFQNIAVSLERETQTRGHRFQKRFRTELSQEMAKAEYNQKDIQRVINKGLVRVDKEGALHWESWNLIKLAAGVLNKILARPPNRLITEEEVIAVLTVHEKIHTIISRRTASRIIDRLKKTLGDTKYKQLVNYFQNQYGSYISPEAGRLTPAGELEIIEELTANMYMERMLGNPLRLLNNTGQIVELEKNIINIIESELKEEGQGIINLTSSEKHNRRIKILAILSQNKWNIGKVKKKIGIKVGQSFVPYFESLDLEHVLKLKIADLLEGNLYNYKITAKKLGIWKNAFARIIKLFGLHNKDIIKKIALAILRKNRWKLRKSCKQLGIRRGKLRYFYKDLNIEKEFRKKLEEILNRNYWNYKKTAASFDTSEKYIKLWIEDMGIVRKERLTRDEVLRLLDKNGWEIGSLINELGIKRGNYIERVRELGIVNEFIKILKKRLKENNWSYKKTGEQYKVSPDTIVSWVDKLEIAKPKKITKTEALKIMRRYKWNLKRAGKMLIIKGNRYIARIKGLKIEKEFISILQKRLDSNAWNYAEAAKLFWVSDVVIGQWVKRYKLKPTKVLTKKEILKILDENNWKFTKELRRKLGIKERRIIAFFTKNKIKRQLRNMLIKRLEETKWSKIGTAKLFNIDDFAINAWMDNLKIKRCKDLSKRKALSILKKYKWNLRKAKDELGVKGWYYYDRVIELELKKELRNKLKERLNLTNWNNKACGELFGVQGYVIAGWKKKLGIRGRSIKDRVLKVLVKNNWNISKSLAQLKMNKNTNIIKFFTSIDILTGFINVLIERLNQENWIYYNVDKLLGVSNGKTKKWANKLNIKKIDAVEHDNSVFTGLLDAGEIDNLLDLFGLEGTYRILLRRHSFSPLNLYELLNRHGRKKNGRNGKKHIFSADKVREIKSIISGSIEDEEAIAEEIINSVYPRLVTDHRFLNAILEESKNPFNTPFLKRVYLRVFKYYNSVKGFKIKGIRAKVGGKGFGLKFYQRIGIKFILDKKRLILADEPGLGKTIQALGAALNANNGAGARRILIISPKSAVAHWRREILTKTTEPTDPVIVNGLNFRKKGTKTEIENSRFVITNYEAIRGKDNELCEFLKEQKFDFVIVDEAHRIRHETYQTDAVREFSQAKYKVLLTGTPLIGKDVKRLRNLFNWLYPEREEFQNRQEFAKRYAGSVNRLRLLRTTLNGMILRRLKHVVLYDLPPKDIENVYVELGAKQRKIYEHEKKRFKNVFLESLRRMGIKTAGILSDTLFSSRIRQAAIDGSILEKQIVYRLVDGREYRYRFDEEKIKLGNKTYTQRFDTRKGITLIDSAGKQTDVCIVKLRTKYRKVIIDGKEYFVSIVKPPPVSAKYEKLDEIVREILKKGEKVVIFSNFRYTVEDLRRRYFKYGVSYITGDMENFAARQEEIDSFQTNPLQRIFISTIPTGGEAITLTAANNVVFIDMPLTPQERNQAIDRVHRIGQTKRVRVYNLIARNTIDEDMQGILNRSELISRLIFDDDPSVEELDEQLMEKVLYRLKYSKDLITRFRERIAEIKRDETVSIITELYSEDGNLAVRFNGDGFMAWLNAADKRGSMIKGFSELINEYKKLDNQSRCLFQNFFKERINQELKTNLKIKESIVWHLCAELAPELKIIDYHGEYEIWTELVRYIINQLIDNNKLTKDELINDIGDEDMVNKVLYFMDRNNLFKALSILGIFNKQYYYSGALLHYDIPLPLTPRNGYIYYSDADIIKEILPDWRKRPKPQESSSTEEIFLFKAKSVPKLKKDELIRLMNEAQRGNTEARKVLAECCLKMVIYQIDIRISGLYRRHPAVYEQLDKGNLYGDGYKILCEIIDRYFDEDEGTYEGFSNYLKKEFYKGIVKYISKIINLVKNEGMKLDNYIYNDGKLTYQDFLSVEPDYELETHEEMKRILKGRGFSDLEIEILMRYRTTSIQKLAEKYNMDISEIEELAKRARDAVAEYADSDINPDEIVLGILSKSEISQRDIEIFIRARDGETAKSLSKVFNIPTRQVKEIVLKCREILGNYAAAIGREPIADPARRYLYPAVDSITAKKEKEVGRFTFDSGGNRINEKYSEQINTETLATITSHLNIAREYYLSELTNNPESVPNLNIRLIKGGIRHGWVKADNNDFVITINIDHPNYVSIEHEVGHYFLGNPRYRILDKLTEEIIICLGSLQLILNGEEPPFTEYEHRAVKEFKDFLGKASNASFKEQINAVLKLLSNPDIHPELTQYFAEFDFSNVSVPDENIELISLSLLELINVVTESIPKKILTRNLLTDLPEIFGNINSYLLKFKDEAIKNSAFGNKQYAREDIELALKGFLEGKKQSGKISRFMAGNILEIITGDKYSKGKVVYSLRHILESNLNDGNGISKLKRFIEKTNGRVLLYAGENYKLDEDYKFLKDYLVTKGDLADKIRNEKIVVYMLSNNEINNLGLTGLKPGVKTENQLLIPIEDKSKVENNIFLGIEIVRNGGEIKDLPYLFKLLLPEEIRKIILDLPRADYDYLKDIDESMRFVEDLISSA